MTIVARLSAPADSTPLASNGIRIFVGALSLVAGAASENIGTGRGLGMTLTGRLVAAGALGHLTADYDDVTGVVSLQSSSGTETSLVAYAVIFL